MKTFFALLLLSFILSGCSSSTLVTPSGKKGDLSYLQFNEKIGADEADIYLKDGQNVSGEDISVSNDTISWVDPDNHGKLGAPVENVRSVIRVNHTTSALIGLGVGAAIGVIVSLEVTAGEHGDSPVGLVWAVAPPAGVVFGAGIGALTGRHTRYEFLKDPTSPVSEGKK
jgi:hypothetical protein